ncbi:MAG TPA: hypothetical protein VHX38_15205 [Pseudonocardiaceae bacterium]|jgi:hypothetical protein|nr:hypothetical protein [Pseudonocardiaceae bacterium]
MITLYFIRAWFKALLGVLLVIAIEYGISRHGLWFLLLAIPTAAGFVGFTVLMYKDWKSSRANGSGYRYDIVRDVTRSRSRDRW